MGFYSQSVTIQILLSESMFLIVCSYGPQVNFLSLTDGLYIFSSKNHGSRYRFVFVSIICPGLLGFVLEFKTVSDNQYWKSYPNFKRSLLTYITIITRTPLYPFALIPLPSQIQTSRCQRFFNKILIIR